MCRAWQEHPVWSGNGGDGYKTGAGGADPETSYCSAFRTDRSDFRGNCPAKKLGRLQEQEQRRWKESQEQYQNRLRRMEVIRTQKEQALQDIQTALGREEEEAYILTALKQAVQSLEAELKGLKEKTASNQALVQEFISLRQILCRRNRRFQPAGKGSAG